MEHDFGRRHPLDHLPVGVDHRTAYYGSGFSPGTFGVTVFEVYKNATRLKPRISRRITEADTLLRYFPEAVPEDVQLRLYVMTGMYSSAIEILGSALKCPAEVFASQMYSKQFCFKGGEKGNTGVDYRACMSCGVELHKSMQAASSLSPSPKSYFSLPFRRPIVYSPGTVPTGYEERNLLVERISGTPFEHLSTGKHAGMLLFDPMPDGLEYEHWHDHVPLFPSVPSFNLPYIPEIPRAHFEDLLSESRFATLWSNIDWTIHADHIEIMPLCICLEMILHEWTSIMRCTERLLRNHSKETFPGDARIGQMVRQGVYMRESLDMLQQTLSLIREERARQSSKAAKDTDVGDNLLSTLESKAQNLIARTEDHVTRFDRQLAITASLIAIEESRNSIRVAQSIGGLTTLATVFVPLSFVASLLGMNVTQLSPQNSLSISTYFIIAIPLTITSLFVVRQWANMVTLFSSPREGWHRLRRLMGSRSS
ncbi:hypothetical protein MMC30_003791 [Trapelia coarctata]|nr:hypothetical protein [Trapelia coarctata]